MKIAFPVIDDKGLEGTIGAHFGRVPKFAIYDNETKTVEIIANTGDHFGGAKSTPQILKDVNVDLLICGGIGRKAISLFDNFKIGVCVTKSILVKDALEEHKQGKLSPANEQDACAGQHGHNH
ncbi:MAG: NifB/NifX family molybdenum-iron cluster-binding protein [Candidatus Heimdallarchaeota archaeon]